MSHKFERVVKRNRKVWGKEMHRDAKRSKLGKNTIPIVSETIHSNIRWTQSVYSVAIVIDEIVPFHSEMKEIAYFL